MQKEYNTKVGLIYWRTRKNNAERICELKNIMLVFGTRPEAVKMCPLALELMKRPSVRVKVCVTGQHREMLSPVLSFFGIEPDADLSVMTEGQTLFDITEKVMRGMRSILEKEKYDLVLVHGDTTTAFAAALSAFYMGAYT